VDYIGRAEHAIRTGQPNLAMLYMRRALSESPQGRTWLAWYDFKRAVADFPKHCQPFIAALAAFGFAVEQWQADFALAGPAKGAP
jgi:hypothetical protein